MMQLLCTCVMLYLYIVKWEIIVVVEYVIITCDIYILYEKLNIQ